MSETTASSFRCFNSSPEVIRLMVLMHTCRSSVTGSPMTQEDIDLVLQICTRTGMIVEDVSARHFVGEP